MKGPESREPREYLSGGVTDPLSLVDLPKEETPKTTALYLRVLVTCLPTL